MHAQSRVRLARMGHLETSGQVHLNHRVFASPSRLWNFNHVHFFCVAPGRYPHDIIYAISVPSVVHGMFRLAGRTIWRLFRFGFQARLQYQGLWRQYSGPWWYDRPNGLPVRRPIPHGLTIPR